MIEKVVLLAGGAGTRLSPESSEKIPKPLVTIGGIPIIQHIMNTYAHYGLKHFIICAGYKVNLIKEYFLNFDIYNNDFELRMNDVGEVKILETVNKFYDWKFTICDTGLETKTATRLKMIKKYLFQDSDENCFALTYGDSLCDINISKLIRFHRLHGKIATVTAVQQQGRFGCMEIGSSNQVVEFKEKIVDPHKKINGGYFIFDRRIFDFIPEKDSMLEDETMENLVKSDQLMAYEHDGFWKPMDTPRDKEELEELWKKGDAPWKV